MLNTLKRLGGALFLYSVIFLGIVAINGRLQELNSNNNINEVVSLNS